jgi:hypothetical protein
MRLEVHVGLSGVEKELRLRVLIVIPQIRDKFERMRDNNIKMNVIR